MEAITTAFEHGLGLFGELVRRGESRAAAQCCGYQLSLLLVGMDGLLQEAGAQSLRVQ